MFLFDVNAARTVIFLFLFVFLASKIYLLLCSNGARTTFWSTPPSIGFHSENSDVHALSGTGTHDPSVRASEDSSCLKPRGHCERLAFERAKTVHALDRAATVID
jgi:hypothetical protein